jgi:hypothetical protein
MRSFFLNIYWATGHPPFLALANKCLLFIFSGRLWRFSVLTLTYCTVRRVAAATATTASPSADIIAGTATDRPMASLCCCPVHLLLLLGQHYRHSNHTSQPFSSPNTI